MSDPMLIVVACTFQQARTFCGRQRINERRAKLVSTDASWRGDGYQLGDQDAVVRYGPWSEGKHVWEALDSLQSMIVGNPFVYDAFMYDEAIPWPSHILERYRLQ